MKRIALLAAVVVLGSSLSTAMAGKKKDKKKKADTEVVAPVAPLVLATTADTLSYAAGRTATQGLIPYLQQEYRVDTAHMADFVKGYEEAIARQSDPTFVAYQAGTQIAQMATKRILPSMKADFEGSEEALIEEIFHKGFASALNNDNTVFNDSLAQAYFEGHRKALKEAQSAAYKKQNEDWLAENRKGEGVITLPDGLQYKVLTMGTGEKPQKDQKVKVKYEGKLIDGTIFDSSYKRNPQTSEFRCDQVIKGWTEALQLMPVGSKWELYIPQDLAYGERQAGTIKPFSTLIFTVELIDIVNDEEKKADADKTATDKKATTDKKAAGGNAAKVAAAKNVARKITKKK